MSDIVSNAYELAQGAAEQAGVFVRLAHEGEYQQIVELFERVWGVRRAPDAALVQSIGYAGNALIVAIDESNNVVGAILGFLGWDEGLHSHSHMAAVEKSRIALGIGRAMKLYQRSVCMNQGITEIRWLYDPLVQRHARLHLARLGAEVSRYLPNFYGILNDEISGQDETDRFEVRWRLNSARVRRALGGIPPAPPVGEMGFRLVRDFEVLRRENPEAAAKMRAVSRDVFTRAFSDGLHPLVDAEGNYVFIPEENQL
ncbi:hypothetical protein [Lysinibacter sp. HNR]|uniref:hypothetical protein n=1 Tax=Lysinibacter sp. HNR TaxID=3031408 RepID=UPI002434A154|nr:hypothetical protein [Lysinibacter sp. HNR]WGD37098.1 hypothetical protein FrondiHNR_11755 [Lysinibacter sp. HNR]